MQRSDDLDNPLISRGIQLGLRLTYAAMGGRVLVMLRETRVAGRGSHSQAGVGVLGTTAGCWQGPGGEAIVVLGNGGSPVGDLVVGPQSGGKRWCTFQG